LWLNKRLRKPCRSTKKLTHAPRFRWCSGCCARVHAAPVVLEPARERVELGKVDQHVRLRRRMFHVAERNALDREASDVLADEVG
jgi:hypothetical protein